MRASRAAAAAGTADLHMVLAARRDVGGQSGTSTHAHAKQVSREANKTSLAESVNPDEDGSGSVTEKREEPTPAPS